MAMLSQEVGLGECCKMHREENYCPDCGTKLEKTPIIELLNFVRASIHRHIDAEERRDKTVVFTEPTDAEAWRERYAALRELVY